MINFYWAVCLDSLHNG